MKPRHTDSDNNTQENQWTAAQDSLRVGMKGIKCGRSGTVTGKTKRLSNRLCPDRQNYFLPFLLLYRFAELPPLSRQRIRLDGEPLRCGCAARRLCRSFGQVALHGKQRALVAGRTTQYSRSCAASMFMKADMRGSSPFFS